MHPDSNDGGFGGGADRMMLMGRANQNQIVHTGGNVDYLPETMANGNLQKAPFDYQSGSQKSGGIFAQFFRNILRPIVKPILKSIGATN